MQAFAAQISASDVIPAQSEEGNHRLERAESKADFLPLAHNYEIQANDFFSGVASSVIVLNALQGKVGYYTQGSFFDQSTDPIKTKAQVMGEPMNGRSKPDPGFQLAQLQKMLQAHHVKADILVVTDRMPEDKIRAEIIKNLGHPDDFMIVNYYRPVLGQNGGGHISPLGAYDKESDSVLIMDVNPSVADWVWVKVPLLVRAMKTRDTAENRGYLIVEKEAAG